MTKHFRVSFLLKTTIGEASNRVELADTFERVRQLVLNIAGNETALIEVYKVLFFDLLNSDFYTDKIRGQMRFKPEPDLILPTVKKMKPSDLAFFSTLLSEPPKEEFRLITDNVMNLFYSQFGCPEIEEIRFESLDNGALD